MAKRQEPRQTDQQRGPGARDDLQALAAIARYSCACVEPTHADPGEKSKRVPEYIHVSRTRAQ
jgi:hypothetical protein